MNILTKRNGIALVAVLAILLVLTLLLPLMFSMSENAMEAAMTGTDEQRASYLARTMIEFSVGAFQECYDAAEDDEEREIEVPDDLENVTDEIKATNLYKLKKFLKKDKKMDISVMYMYRTGVAYPEYSPPEKNSGESDADYRKRCLQAYSAYMDDGVIYSTTVPSGCTEKGILYDNQVPTQKTSVKRWVRTNAGIKEETVDNCVYLGYSTCTIVYNDAIEYYNSWTNSDGSVETELIKTGGEAAFTAFLEKAKGLYKANSEFIPTKENPQVFKVENRNVEFTSYANVNGKGSTRRCILVLPTKPSENSWIVPANIESNQIFPDTSQCSSVTALQLKNNSLMGDIFTDSAAIQGQPVYSFSCVGNMVLTKKNIKYKATEQVKVGETVIIEKDQTMDYLDYIDAYNAAVDDHNDIVNKANEEIKAYNAANPKNPKPYRSDFATYIDNNYEDFSFGLHPETTTVNPERDPTFNCLKTNNMRTWAGKAQRDNFVAFTATNGIQFDMPVNVIMNPCRTGRIGDGIERNQSLYKVLYLQAPTIVFNQPVNSFVSLYTKTSLLALAFDYNAYRMSSIILAAPESTPYTMEVPSIPDVPTSPVKTVRAGKVYFAEDAYVWLVPFTENGSNYKTQSVYYKGKDVILYKFAEAGDVFLFNAEKETEINGELKKAGFSMTGYFMDVIYSKENTKTSNHEWWQLWSGIQNMIFGAAVENVRDRTYYPEDLQWIGNMNNGTQNPPVVDDFYVIWES